MRTITFAEAILEAQTRLLETDPRCFIMGEGIIDKNAIFGTCTGLYEKFPGRVIESPISENGMTGVCIGAAIAGMRPIHIHQRMDFMLYAMDQIVNNAAKWYSMFGGQAGNCPLIIRCIIGRGWGQGNQHSQDLTKLFQEIPGLIICTPSNAHDAKGLLIAAHRNPNPVIFIEHRWLHHTTSVVPENLYELSFEDKLIREGDREIHATGYGVIECLKAAEFLSAEGIELRITEKHTFQNNKPYPPSTSGLIKGFYPNFLAIVKLFAGERKAQKAVEYFNSIKHHDIPNADFRGPF